MSSAHEHRHGPHGSGPYGYLRSPSMDGRIRSAGVVEHGDHQPGGGRLEATGWLWGTWPFLSRRFQAQVLDIDAELAGKRLEMPHPRPGGSLLPATEGGFRHAHATGNGTRREGGRHHPSPCLADLANAVRRHVAKCRAIRYRYFLVQNYRQTIHIVIKFDSLELETIVQGGLA
jgi:hypothetical protein